MDKHYENKLLGMTKDELIDHINYLYKIYDCQLMEYNDSMPNIGCDPPGKELKVGGFSLPKMTAIPYCMSDHQEIAKMMRINVDVLKKEITDHIDVEIARMKREMTNG